MGLITFPLFEIDDFPRRWPRRQEDSLEAGDGEVAGLGLLSWNSVGSSEVY